MIHLIHQFNTHIISRTVIEVKPVRDHMRDYRVNQGPVAYVRRRLLRCTDCRIRFFETYTIFPGPIVFHIIRMSPAVSRVLNRTDHQCIHIGGEHSGTECRGLFCFIGKLEHNHILFIITKLFFE